ncbi:thiopeptide-type bacteriocin biosynthesis protein [Virgibacillus sp. MSJ-26]|uniref:thiopeptide-type bacteriocin biosynthesis protein n=1 Tax=Virgibacillus sp. MSJ-26 TaxID=2841522 RepID=UPI001C126459|nr:thiopeptide-type bacteriocin biosynthesis protein [Virgibacillus sp. MSJ-26]MBU5467371.1 thiopeptide-type bacteriocin biosynthesis protein [Virgibacillus sp. MSJ-26]
MWISKHIFIHDYQLIDTYLKDVLLPLADKELSGSYFFIRYWDGGPHVRIRYKEKKNKTDNSFEYKLQWSLEQFRIENKNWDFKTVIDDERVENTEGKGSGISHPNFSIQSIDYNPEYLRYGGQSVMNISEEIFKASSEFASSIIQQVSRNKRYQIAFDVMYECGRLIEKMGLIQNLKQFYQDYFMVWIEFQNQPDFEQLKKALIKRAGQLENKDTLKPYRPYLSFLEEKMNQIRKNQSVYKEHEIFYIAISHMHMLNNRLGVSPDYEYIFSKILFDYYQEKVYQQI